MTERARANLARGLSYLDEAMSALSALDDQDEQLPTSAAGRLRRANRRLSEARECFERSSRLLAKTERERD